MTKEFKGIDPGRHGRLNCHGLSGVSNWQTIPFMESIPYIYGGVYPYSSKKWK
jgi:hypothetical protein